jgi:broad specificity phosphatase PhoE
VVARYREELAAITDIHRGETVLVVAHQQAATIALPLLADNVSRAWSPEHPLDSAESAELVIDSDAWRLSRWGSVSLP